MSVINKLRHTVCESFFFLYRRRLLPEYHRASIRHNSLAGVYECVSVYARACDKMCVNASVANVSVIFVTGTANICVLFFLMPFIVFL